ncbi:NAD(P)/FAD-dependent oxidoreductase [Salinisphaera hydrothermalis]|uniref:NAD(P)/FAD-dependent oxidoreductase n=1 Tax=Salinisphaera hydrothermalis TaxID=563188 RepID=UPI0033424310
MPAPLITIASSESLPAAADVVVIGGGVIGTCAAHFLAKRGLKVALLEKGRIAGEQSSRNWGWCRQQNRDARELDMATHSLAMWEQIAQDLDVDLGFRRCGLMYLSDDEAEIEGWAKWGRFARGEGIDTRMMTAAEAAARGKATGKPWKGGVWSPTDGTADTSRAVPLIAEGLKQQGSTVHQFCAARGIESAGGKVTGVFTEHGTVRTSHVVMAGGVWASTFVKQLGISFPQTAARSSILSVMPPKEELPATLHTRQVSVTRRSDGAYTLAISGLGRIDPTIQGLRYARQFLPMFARRWRVLSLGDMRAWLVGHERRQRWRLDQPTPMEANRVLDPLPERSVVDLTLHRARQLLPGLSASPVQASWAGYIDSTPDGVPVIDPAVGPEGFMLAAGFSGHGFGIGPGAGDLIADLISGREPDLPYKQYALSRLTRTSRDKVADF